MKILTVLFSLLFAGAVQASMFNCSQNEAQFIGSVKTIEKDYLDQNQVQCLFEIEFSHFQPSMVCPLDFASVINVKHTSDCSIQKGDHVSGIMVEKNGFIYIE